MKALLLLALLALAGPAAAGDFAFELGADVVHAPGLRMWSLSIENENSRFRVGSFGQGGIEVRFVGAEYVFRLTEHCSLGFGAVHLEHRTPLNGVHWNFSIAPRCMVSQNVFVGLWHFSHGSGVGIEPDKTNLGGSFLTFGSLF